MDDTREYYDEVEDAEEEQEETNAGDNENDDDDDDNDDDDGDNETMTLQRHPKKRKLKSLLSSYEFAPRVPPPTSTPKPSFGGRNTLTDWSEHETFVLLEAWGDRFRGRKSLRSEEWQEVADRVSQESKMVRTDSQCRNRLDTLKKKYKKEKAGLKSSKWVYFKKMDMLLSSNYPSGNINNTNGVYETRGSSGNSDYREHDANNNNDVDVDDDDEDDDDDSDSAPAPPKKSKSKTKASASASASFKLLADSINKFSEIYEKVENSKIQQMIELERMRMDFHRDLESQKRQLLDTARAEITKERGGYDDNDGSADNVSG